MKTKPLKTKLMTVLLTLCMVLSIVPLSVFAAEPTVIDKVNFDFEIPDYNAGDTLKACGSIKDSDAHYTIYDECFKEYKHKQGETDVIVKTGREWHSNQIAMSYVDSDKQITTVEAGKIYLYSIVFQPQNSDYKFTEDTKVFRSLIDIGTPKDSKSLELVDSSIRLQYTYLVEISVSDSSKEQTVTNVSIENVKFDYQPGDVPQVTAMPSEVDIDKYDIVYECWQEFENNNPVSAWYSDNGSHGSLPALKKFESGKSYVYSLMLKPKDGYSFSSETVVTVNGQKVSSPFSNGVMYIPSIKTINIPALIAIDLIEIENVTVNFKDGDKPVFTGKVPDGAKYAFRGEWWSLDSNTGLISTEPEWGSDIYKNKITAFEAGKTYHYGVYVTAYYDVFSPDAKLKINGQYVDFKRIGDENNKQSMWLETELTMTPQASGKAPDYKFIEGAGGTWTKNTDGTLTFRANGDFSKFTGVKIDGANISAENYTAVSGSTVVTLKKNYLETLSVGNHTLTVMFNDGESSTEFTVNAANSGGTKSDTPNEIGTKSPKTGYFGSTALWIAMLFIIGGATVGAVILTEKKKQSR